MSETMLHHELVAYLLERLASERTVFTHVVGRAKYPDPYKIGRHAPDLIAESDRQFIIGKVKTGEDLEDETTREQLQDFLAYRAPTSGERPIFYLCVPCEWRDAAREAIEEAGGEVDGHWVNVLTIKKLVGR